MIWLAAFVLIGAFFLNVYLADASQRTDRIRYRAACERRRRERADERAARQLGRWR